MKKINFYKLGLMFCLCVAGNIAIGASPGEIKYHWSPNVVSQLTPAEVKILNNNGCMITSYGPEPNQAPSSSTPAKPREEDTLMLLRNEFATRGQTDLIVFCKSKTKKDSYFFQAIWGGQVQCKNTLKLEDTSRYIKKYGLPWDYYGGYMKEMQGPSINEYIKNIPIKNSESAHLSDDPIELWTLDIDRRPQINHNAILYLSGEHRVLFSCSNGNWTILVSEYNNSTD